MTCEEQAAHAIYKLTALQTLTRTTGTITNRAQRELLRSLPADVMTVVAEHLFRTKNPLMQAKPTPEPVNVNSRR